MLKDHDTSRRLDFGHFVDRVFWALLTGTAMYVATQVKDMSESVEQLNRNMAVVLYQVTESKAHLERNDMRLERLEQKGR